MLKPFGVEVDSKTNDKIAGWKDIHEGLITTPNSKIPVYVIPTNEEIMIIRDTYDLIQQKRAKYEYLQENISQNKKVR